MQYRLLAILAACGGTAIAQSSTPAPAQADYVLKNFSFTSGESLPELKIHYRTLGKPQRDVQGVVRNAVLISHGTGGAGPQGGRLQTADWSLRQFFGLGFCCPLQAARTWR